MLRSCTFAVSVHNMFSLANTATPVGGGGGTLNSDLPSLPLNYMHTRTSGTILQRRRGNINKWIWSLPLNQYNLYSIEFQIISKALLNKHTYHPATLSEAVRRQHILNICIWNESTLWHYDKGAPKSKMYKNQNQVVSSNLWTDRVPKSLLTLLRSNKIEK